MGTGMRRWEDHEELCNVKKMTFYNEFLQGKDRAYGVKSRTSTCFDLLITDATALKPQRYIFEESNLCTNILHIYTEYPLHSTVQSRHILP